MGKCIRGYIRSYGARACFRDTTVAYLSKNMISKLTSVINTIFSYMNISIVWFLHTVGAIT